MRKETDHERLNAFMAAIGSRAKGEGKVYLVGGASAVLLGIRSQTIDIDIKLDPEPQGVFEAIAFLKESLSVNVELASPDLFLPPLPGWQERSEFIVQVSRVTFYHYDFYSQVLAKILRGHEKDIADARAFVRIKKLSQTKLSELFAQVKDRLLRYPSIDPDEFGARVKNFVDEMGGE